jgi:hypothetical protein
MNIEYHRQAVKQKTEQMLLYEIASRFIPDDYATPHDIAVREAAMIEYIRGETVNHDDINWD